MNGSRRSCTVSGAVALSIALLLASVRLGRVQAGTSTATGPNLSHPTQVVAVTRNGYMISGLVTHLRDGKTFKYGIALFLGYPGIMRLREEDGRPRFELRGNFLVRSRRHWLDEETLVVVVDAPSDQWATFSQRSRESPRYGTVRGGGPGRGESCQAFTAHGFVGVERETVVATRSWGKSGVVPADVKR